MDYFCAFSVVVFSLLAFFLRLIPARNFLYRSLATSVCLALFLNHVYTMAMVRFDYGWNMALNVGVGAVNSVCWFAFSYWVMIHEVKV